MTTDIAFVFWTDKTEKGRENMGNKYPGSEDGMPCWELSASAPSNCLCCSCFALSRCFTVKLPPEAASRGSATIEPLKFAIWDHTDSAELTTMLNASWTPPLQNCWGAHQAQNLASYCWSESPTLEKDATVDFCFISETSFAPLLAVLQDKTINTSQVYCSASTSCPRLWYTKSIEGERERKKEGNSISLCTRLENADSWLWARRENNRSVLAEEERTRLT